MHKLTFALIVLASAMPAQILSFGVKGGIPVTRALPYHSSGQDIHTGRWTVGPTAEFHLPARLSIEIDGLYRSYHLNETMLGNQGDSNVLLTFKQEVRAWDFPLLLKYRFTQGQVRPFVNAGFQLTHESSDFTATCEGGSGACTALLFRPSIADSLNRTGPVAGAGLGIPFHKVELSPEVRYTRLNKPGTNQVTVLFGVTF